MLANVIKDYMIKNKYFAFGGKYLIFPFQRKQNNHSFV